MKKRGFTLVELLAVIVVLAIILVIAVPKIGDVIYSSRKNVFKTNAYGLVSAAEKLYQELYVGSLNEVGILYDIENGKILHDGVEVDIVDGKIDGIGFIHIDGNGESKIAIENHEFCAAKQFNEAEVNVSDKEDGVSCGKIYVSLDVERNGGTLTQDFESSYLEHTKITLLEPTKENSSFAGWKVIKGNSFIKDNVLTIGSKDTIIFALWKDYPTLTLVLGEGGTTTQSYKSGTTIELINPTREGYTFAGWERTSGNSIISGNILTMGSEDTVITALWKINTYTITYDLDGGTKGANAPTSGTYGSTVEISNPTKTGYKFNGWTVSGKDVAMSGTSLTIGTSDVTLTANWDVNIYTISYNLADGTNASGNPTSGTYGSTVTVSNPTRAGWTFTGWILNGEGSNLDDNKLTIGTGDVTLTAKFETNFATYVDYMFSHSKSENSLSNADPAGNIRYSGSNSVVKNYVIYNDELWRIIGKFNVSDGSATSAHIKIVRNDLLLGTSSIDSSPNDINTGKGVNEWSQADLMYLLNDYYAGTGTVCKYCSTGCIGVSTWTDSPDDCSSIIKKLDSTALSMLDKVVWNTGAVALGNSDRETYTTITAATAYNSERGSSTGKQCVSNHVEYCSDTIPRYTTWAGKVGLVYPSDYAYASSDTNCHSNIVATSYYCKNNNWLHTSNPRIGQWTMTPAGWWNYNNSFIYFNTETDPGKIDDHFAHVYLGVKPVVYLKNSVKLVGGTGTASNPYQLSGN